MNQDNGDQQVLTLTLDGTHFVDGTGLYEGTREKCILHTNIDSSFVALEVTSEYFQTTVCLEFISCLKNLREKLVSLSVTIKPKHEYLLEFEDLHLPNLVKFNIKFIEDNFAVSGFNLGQVFKACPNLQKLGFRCGTNVFPSNILLREFSKDFLPTMLTSLDLSTRLESEHLQQLAQSSLPNLKSLVLLVHHKRFENETIFQVLDNVRRSLEYLVVKGESHNGIPKQPTIFDFPTMESLTILHMESQYFELKSDTCSLENYLPKLNWLRLMLQTQNMLDKWINSRSSIKSLKKLYITMTNDNYTESDPKYHVNLNAENMKRIAKTFPNVKTLQVDFRGDDNLDCLVVIFSEMAKLERLEIFVNNRQLILEDTWTSALLAVPVEVLPDLKSKELLLGPNHPTAMYSIKNLQNLKTLKITSKWVVEGEHLISDLVFEEAFFHLPELQTLILTNQLASDEMLHRWKDMGRELEIYRKKF